jgi:hypothetical protein
MSKKLVPYMHKTTGDVKLVTKREGKKLGKDYSGAQFTKNEKGEDVMRFEIAGGNGVTAIVDISETGEQEVELDGNGNPKEIHS